MAEQLSIYLSLYLFEENPIEQWGPNISSKGIFWDSLQVCRRTRIGTFLGPRAFGLAILSILGFPSYGIEWNLSGFCLVEPDPFSVLALPALQFSNCGFRSTG